MTILFKHIQAIVQLVSAIIHEKQYADKAFEHYFKTNRSLSEVDKGFIVQEVHYVIRNWRFLNEIRIALCFPSDIPVLLNIGWIIANKCTDEIKLISRSKWKDVIQASKDVGENKAVLYSFPDWLYELGNSELKEAWEPILQDYNNDALLVIRTNTLKCTKDSLRQALQNQGIKVTTHLNAPDALIIQRKINVFKLPEFKGGYFEMHDVSSQLVGHFASPQPGMRVIDGCAGNGGKTLHLASLMKNKGKVIALDLFAGKLDTLRCRASRAGISIIETRTIDTTKVVKRLYSSADLVLLDVPCSGLGVLKRNPEIKWRLQPNDLENLRKTQEDILNRYSLMVKPGGTLVYSTCSVLPSENALQVKKFLQTCGNQFDFVEDRVVSPTEGFDGFYMAKMLRKHQD